MSETPPPAGWYPHPTMAGTQRYWDGRGWTDQVAPAQQPPRPAKRIGVGTIAGGVIVGLIVVIALIVLVVTLVTADDDLDCATDNANRSQNGQPLKDCD